MNTAAVRGLALFAMLLLLALPAAGGDVAVCTLENGLQVAVRENPRSPLVTVRIYVRVGSMWEDDLLGAGLSHLLEHIVSGGSTRTRSEAQGERLAARIGGQVNAYTTKDHTCYHITTLSEYFEPALELLTDWVTNATITTKEFTREQGVILREMGTRYARPETLLFEQYAQLMFRVHPARHPVIGYEDLFKKVTREDALRFYQRWYRPNHMLLVVAGNVNSEHVFSRVQERLGRLPRGPEVAKALPSEPEQVCPRVHVQRADVQVAYLALGYRTVPVTHADLYPLDLAAFVLGHGPSARLVRAVRDEQKLVHSISCWSDTPAYDAGNFTIFATLDPNRLEAAKAAIIAELERLKREPVAAEELAKAKRQKVAEHFQSLQTVEDQAQQVAWDLMATGDPEFSAQYTARIQRVTTEEIQQVAQRYFAPERLCLYALVPRSAPATKTTSEETTATLPRPTSTESAPAISAIPDGSALARNRKETTAGELEKHVLPNGLTVICKRNADLPLVSAVAVFLGGVRADPPGKAGLCHLTADMLMRGTKSRSAHQITTTLDALGATMSASAGNNSLYVSATCLKEDLGQVLEILADVVRHPTFPEDELERRRNLQLAAIRRGWDDLHTAGMRLLRKEVYGGAEGLALPYAWDALGVEETVKSLTRADLVAMHARLFGANNMVLAIVGDITPAAALETARAHFSDFSAVPDPKLREAAHLPPPRAKRIQQTTTKEMAIILLGYPGITLRDTKDRPAMEVLDAIVSGIRLPGGWLHRELRGRQLVYEVHAYNWIGLDPGLFVTYAICEPDKVNEVREVILKHYARATRYLPPAEELDIAKKASATAQALELQENIDQALDMALNELYDLGYDYSQRFREAILAVTAEDVRRVAQRYLTEPVEVVLTKQ